MAESTVTFLLHKLAALPVEELKLLKGVRRELEYIGDELERMTAFLRVADAMEVCDQEIKVWVKQVRDVVYDTEDVLDESTLYLTYHHHWPGLYGFLLECFHSVKHLTARHRIASKIKVIKSRVSNISEGHQRYRFKCNAMKEGSTSASSSCHERRGDALLLEEAELVGIDKHKRQLMEFLFENENGLKVISVVGMGGMGKTTLAKKVYDDTSVKRQFQSHVWSTVSQSFMIEELLKDIIEQLFREIKKPVPEAVNNMDSNHLKMEIKEFLQQKSYVIVLDDVWSTEAWEAIKCAFPDSNNHGGRIMLTTRNADIASTSHGNLYPLKPLSEEDSWTLFCRKTFHKANSCPQHLEELCRGILKRCEGLPLAIVAIGGLLSTKDKRRIGEWEIIHRSLGTELEGNDKLDSMKKILLLSYNELPYYLKACFMYFSFFPEDHMIKRMKLIRLWTGDGLVEQKGGQTPEEVAEGYLNQLVNRSLIQIAKTTRNRRISACRIHDLLREISLLKSRELNFAAVADGNNTRVPDSLDESPVAAVFNGGLRLLKVLDLEGASLEIFPKSVLQLLLLRYLSLRGTEVRKIPKSIGRLKYLETLDLKHSHVSELPVEILKLQQLRHLLVYRYQKGSSSPFHATYGFKGFSGIGGLQSLQKLCFVEANQGSNILSELGRLTQLRKLGLTKLRREDGMELCSSIQKLSNLRSLDVNSIDEDEIINIQCLSSPPRYLERLWLQGRLETLPPWIPSLHSLVKLRLRWSQLGDDPLESLQALPSLVELQLRQAYDGDALHFKAGGFQGLRALYLHDLKRLTRVTVEEGAMPCLEELWIICCELLEAVPSGIQFLTKLKSLGFADMDNELIRKLKCKEGNDYSKIMSIPEVIYTYWFQNSWNQICL
ncbi:hypothetical protein F0562_011865 [Nyssa sinensis]|uniref:Disease resistance protein RPM1-like n=1 Tax=Nyssa sinensis TaxID=561372 RepID=A0A5J4ZRZ6_9ASTE|nr:hypothetical protein F0562_011865 [Nyssa sinensis]